MNKIFVDNFAGGGGASTGIELAIGKSVDIAINHDPDAIAMHKVNHPDTKHYCENIWEVDPIEACAGNQVALAWFSPDCKHFSKAKGGKPVDKNIRGLAWVAIKWAKLVKPDVIMLENVEEFKDWCPLNNDGYPDKSRKGETFKEFVTGLEKVGYAVEWRELRACDYGAPTTRKRLFLIARCDNKPIVWAEATHGHPDSLEVRSGMLKAWRTAAEIIDWSIPGKTIFNRKKPLADNTLKRIARGIQKFVIDSPDPFIVRIGQTGFGKDKLQYSINQPLTTITTKAEHLLVAPTIMVNTTQHSGSNIDQPIKTITTSGNHAIITSFLAKHYGGNYKGAGSDLFNPIGTITTVDHHAIVTAFLTKFYSSDVGQSLDAPLHTILTNNKIGIVMVKGEEYKITDITMRMLQPRELFNAQGFPDEYIIDVDADGNVYSKTKQVARCGNAVSPEIPKALVRANLPEYCRI